MATAAGKSVCLVDLYLGALETESFCCSCVSNRQDEVIVSVVWKYFVPDSQSVYYKWHEVRSLYNIDIQTGIIHMDERCARKCPMIMCIIELDHNADYKGDHVEVWHFLLWSSHEKEENWPFRKTLPANSYCPFIHPCNRYCVNKAR